MAEVFVSEDPHMAQTVVTTRLDRRDLALYSDRILELAVSRVADDIAKRFLAEHAQDILKALDPQAVANLAVADSAAGVREALHKKLPDKIVEVVRTETEVYQRGIFGGMKRIS